MTPEEIQAKEAADAAAADAAKIEQERIEKEKQEKAGQGKTFTQKELDEIVGREKSEAKEKAKKEMEEALAQEKKLASMKAEEREAELAKIQKEKLDSKEKDLTLRENKLEAHKKLNELDMPIDFADWLVDEDKVKTLENITNFTAKVDALVASRVAKVTEGVTPPDPTKPAVVPNPTDDNVKNYI